MSGSKTKSSWRTIRLIVTEITRADLDQLRYSLSAQIGELRRDMDIRFAQVDAKLDAKPSVAALYQAVLVMLFGLSAVITGTVVVLKNVGLLH
jgi:hypothetical protein